MCYWVAVALHGVKGFILVRAGAGGRTGRALALPLFALKILCKATRARL